MTPFHATQSNVVADKLLTDVRWHISTYSEGGGGSCVEAGLLSDGTGRVAVRHSHHPQDGPVIVYTHAEWDAFVAGVKDGEFDFT